MARRILDTAFWDDTDVAELTSNAPDGVFIYALCDPKSMEIRYIGKTQHIKKRLNCYKAWSRCASSCPGTPVLGWIAHLLRTQGRMPHCEILENVRQEEWRRKEREWIARGRYAGLDLLNRTKGG